MRFDVLNRDLNVFAPHFLEASAGTGKTFAIEHLVVRLLIESDIPITIEQILVVTFTRAATRELRSRIRRTLFQTKEELVKGKSSIDYLQAICEKGLTAVKTAIEKIDAALICFDTAQIFTLHGFCHRILNEFAFEAGVALNISDPDKERHILFFEQIVKDYLRKGAVEPEYSPLQLQSVLRQFQRQPRKMINSLTELALSNRDIRTFPSHGDLLNGFLACVYSLPDLEYELLKQDLERLVPCYKKMTDEDLLEQMELFCRVISQKQCSADQFDTLWKADFFLKKMTPENLKQREKLPDASSLNYPGMLQKLQSLLPFLEHAKDSSKTFLRLAHHLQK